MNSAAATPSHEPIKQLVGRVEDVYPESGIQPRLRFSINVSNRNKDNLELVNITARLHVQFSDEGHGASPGFGVFIADAVQDRSFSSNTVSTGEAVNQWTIFAPFPLHIFAEFEQARAGRDVIFQLNVVYTVIQRTAQGDLGSKYLTTELLHERIGGNQFLPLSVPKSRWQGILTNLGYSEELRASKQTLLDAVQAAVQAKEEAEAAAKAAKEASTLTGVTALAEAYSQEAASLHKTSRWWLIASSGLAVFALVLMCFYVVESFQISQFTASQTIVRVTVLGVLFAGFGLCMRSYNAYQHLELLNRHRVNIGRTFEVFKAAQPSDKAKEVLAAITAQEMIDFGRGNFPGKDASDGQLSLIAEVVKNLVERPK